MQVTLPSVTRSRNPAASYTIPRTWCCTAAEAIRPETCGWTRGSEVICMSSRVVELLWVLSLAGRLCSSCCFVVLVQKDIEVRLQAF